MNAPVAIPTPTPVPPYRHTPLFPLGPDTTPYRKISSEGVRIETVLGKKRALEVEIEALSQGLLPQTIVDSLDAQRYLRDDEEYWPFEGEDWEDEYVGGEGLR